MTEDKREIADVSVIMPAWRAADTIQRALASVAAQTVRPREIIVVDDGSDDETSARAREMTDDLAPVALKVLRQDNAGPGAARNRAVRESSGALLGFLDADDEWLPEKLERSLSCLADPDIVLVATNLIVDTGEGAVDTDSARHLPPDADAFVALFKRGFVSTATVVCRRDAVVAVGGFDESLLSGQDYELWLAIARGERRRIVILPDFLTRYHVMPESVSSRIDLRRRCALEIAKRHAPGLLKRAACPACVLVFRLAVLTMEAVTGQLRRGALVSAPWPLLALPYHIVDACIALIFPGPGRTRQGPRTP